MKKVILAALLLMGTSVFAIAQNPEAEEENTVEQTETVETVETAEEAE